jgi:hypothetical protein
MRGHSGVELPAEGGTPTKLGAGDSLTVERDTGDLIVKLDESARIRLVRMPPAGGALHPLLALIGRSFRPEITRVSSFAREWTASPRMHRAM